MDYDAENDDRRRIANPTPRWWHCKYIVDNWWGLKMGASSLINPSSASSPSPRIMVLMDTRGLSTLYAADRMLRSVQKITMVLLVAVLVFVTSSGLNNEILGSCPK